MIAPVNHAGDAEGCTWNADNTVATPTGWKDAYKQMVEGGWTALSSDPKYGGQGMPAVVSYSFGQMTAAASAAISMYPGLSHGVYSAL